MKFRAKRPFFHIDLVIGLEDSYYSIGFEARKEVTTKCDATLRIN